jgi:hypothetical protein
VSAIDQQPVTVSKTIRLDSIESLMNVADELGRPVIHETPLTDAGNHCYRVYDGEMMYEFVLPEHRTSSGGR